VRRYGVVVPRREALPPPLPPETRTVGQLVAETIRFYGEHFWRGLALGLAPAIVDAVLLPELSHSHRITVTFTVVPVVLALSYLYGSLLVVGRRPDRSGLAMAFLVGLVVFVPFPLLANLFLIPAAIWLALMGLSIAAAALERTGFYGSLKRGLQLSLSDFTHALGSILTLSILYFLTRLALGFALRGGSDTSEQAAAFLADLVLSPILFLGAGMLYVDQTARAAVQKAAADASSEFN
jgi:hypothetical protein